MSFQNIFHNNKSQISVVPSNDESLLVAKTLKRDVNKIPPFAQFLIEKRRRGDSTHLNIPITTDIVYYLASAADTATEYGRSLLARFYRKYNIDKHSAFPKFTEADKAYDTWDDVIKRYDIHESFLGDTLIDPEDILEGILLKKYVDLVTEWGKSCKWCSPPSLRNIWVKSLISEDIRTLWEFAYTKYVYPNYIQEDESLLSFFG